MTTSYRLHVTPPQGEPYDVQFEGPEIIIGRASDSGLPLTDRFLSRHHAKLYVAGDELMIVDLGSRNGTQVNGNQAESATVVGPGDVITMCGSVITVHDPSTTGSAGQVVSASFSDSDLSGQTMFRKVSDVLESSVHIDTDDIDDQALRRYTDRLKLLNEVHQALAGPMELDDLLQLILERAFDHLKPEEGTIFLKQDDGDLVLAARHQAPGVQRQTLYSRSLVHEVTEKGVGALVYDVESDERFAQAHSILTSGVRSLVAAPLLDHTGSLGMIVLDSRAAIRHFSEEDLELLVSLASVAAMRIRNVKLAEEAAQRRSLEKELELARRIQVALLPPTLPELEGYELHAGNRPSRTVSGDYYEVVMCPENGKCVLMLADVSGKGMAASLLTASLEALSAGPIEMGLPPDEISRQVGTRLHKRTPPEKYATAFLASLELDTGVFQFTNAGHNPALLVRADGKIERLGATGTPLGLLPGAEYRSEERTLEPGDTLVVYTDGITEAANQSDEEYSTERLEDICRTHNHDEITDLVTAIEQDLEMFCDGVPFNDDVTLVLMRRRA